MYSSLFNMLHNPTNQYIFAITQCINIKFSIWRISMNTHHLILLLLPLCTNLRFTFTFVGANAGATCWAGPWRSSNLPGKVDNLALQTESHNALDSEKLSKEIWRLDKRILSGSSATFLGGGGCGGGVGRKGRIICFICTLFAALWATVPPPGCPPAIQRSRTALVGLRRHAEPLLWAWAAHPIDPPAGILCPVESSLRWEDNSYLAGIRTVPLS